MGNIATETESMEQVGSTVSRLCPVRAVQRAVLDSLAQVARFDAFAAVEVRDSALL